MTAAQLTEVERVIMMAAIANAVAGWPAGRLESCPEAEGQRDTAIVIARVSKRIFDETQKVFNA